MQTKSLTQVKNKVVSVVLSTILMFSLVFGVAPISVFATSSTNSFEYTASTHDVKISGDSVYDAMIKELQSKMDKLGRWDVKRLEYTTAIGAITLIKELDENSGYEKSASEISESLSNSKLSTALSLLGGVSIVGADETAVGTHEVKLKIGDVVSTLASYTITPKALTITADNKNIKAGEAVPADLFTYTVSGTINSEDALVSGAAAYTTNYTTNSAEGEVCTITPEQGSLTVGNGNYTLVGATYVNGLLTVDSVTSNATIPLSSNTVVYSAQSNLQAIKESFATAAKAALTGEMTKVSNEITAADVVVTSPENSDVTAVGTYQLSLNIKGDLPTGETIDGFAKYNYTFTQTVTVEKFSNVNIYVNSNLGTYTSTFKVLKEENASTAVGLNLLGFYIVVPNNTNDALISELENAQLTVTASAGSNILAKDLTVDTSSIDNNFGTTVHKGVLIESDLIEELITSSSNGIVDTISSELSLPIDLGSYNKMYDGKPLANIEGEALTELSNDVLNKIIVGLNDLKSQIEKSNISMPTDVNVSEALGGTISFAGLNIDLSKLYTDEINQIISDIDSLINQIQSGVNTGVNSVEGLFDIVEALGSTQVSLKVTPSTELNTVVNAGESSTVTLSIELAITVNLNTLLKNNGLEVEDLIGSFLAGILGSAVETLLDINITIPVSIPVASVNLGVEELPVTVYYDAQDTDGLDDNGGVFYPVDPGVLKAQLSNDHYTVVNTINYLLLSDSVKAELSADVLDIVNGSVSHTLGSNYKVSIKPMTDDFFYGDISTEIKNTIDKVEEEVNALQKELEELRKEIENLADDAEEALEILKEKEKLLLDKIAEKTEQIENAKDIISDILDAKIDSLTNVFEALEGVIDGVDLDKIKETIKDYAYEGLEELQDYLREEAEKLAKEILEKAYEELQKLELQEKLDKLEELAREELIKALAAVDSKLPIVQDIGTATKTYNGLAFEMSETGVATELLAKTTDVKTEISNFEITALSEIVLSELISDQIPADVKSTYTKVTDTLEKLGLDLSGYEMKILGALNGVDSLKNEAETALNNEIQKLVGEVEKVEEIVNNANAMTVGELEEKLEAIEDSCEYISVVVDGNTTEVNASVEDIAVRIYATIANQKIELVTLTAKLEIEKIVLDVEIENQSIAHNGTIDLTKFSITSSVDSALLQEATDSVELYANSTNTAILAKIKDTALNFELGTVTDGVLTVAAAPVNPTTPPTTTTTTTTTTAPAPVVIPVLPEVETEIEEPEVPLADGADDEEPEVETEIEDVEVPLSSGDEGSSWWLIALAALVAGLFIIILLAKRRKEEEEEETV